MASVLRIGPHRLSTSSSSSTDSLGLPLRVVNNGQKQVLPHGLRIFLKAVQDLMEVYRGCGCIFASIKDPPQSLIPLLRSLIEDFDEDIGVQQYRILRPALAPYIYEIIFCLSLNSMQPLSSFNVSIGFAPLSKPLKPLAEALILTLYRQHFPVDLIPDRYGLSQDIPTECLNTYLNASSCP